jgi:hypothetical protein
VARSSGLKVDDCEDGRGREKSLSPFGGALMKTRLLVLWCCVTLLATLAFAQSFDQTARVASIEKMAANAQHPEDVDRYKIMMRMGATLYKCEATGTPALFMGWSPGKEFPAHLNGKVLLVKSPNGDVAQLDVKKTSRQ